MVLINNLPIFKALLHREKWIIKFNIQVQWLWDSHLYYKQYNLDYQKYNSDFK